MGAERRFTCAHSSGYASALNRVITDRLAVTA
jgi:hypothetical protein